MKNDQPDPQQQQSVQFVDIHTGTPGLDHSKITDPEDIAALKSGLLVFFKLVHKKMAQEEKGKEQEQETVNDGGAERTP